MYGGIQKVKIVKVKKDYTDLTISIPIQIIGAFAADFDGDQMNSWSLKYGYLKKAYDAFDPRKNMIISKNDGLFDNNFNLIKDQLIAFHYFNTLGDHKIKVLEGPNGEPIKEKPKDKKKEKSKDGIRHVKVRRIKD